MASSEIIEALEDCEIFSMLDRAAIEQIADLCTLETYEAGDTVISQGQYCTRIYLIADGQVALVRAVNLGQRQGEMMLDLLGKGRGMGWSSVLCEPCSASASARCQKPTRFITLEGAKLRTMLEENPVIGFAVMDRLAQLVGNRLRAAYGAMDTFK